MSEASQAAKGTPPRRRVRSFVRRGGRITAAQARALGELQPRFGVEFTPAPLDLARVFGREAPLLLEIGFGNGDVLVDVATRRPDWNCLGVEVHEPGVGHVYLEAARRELRNLRVICHDAVEVLESQIGTEACDEILIFFPDPWPKKRHHKRRLIQQPFVTLLAARLTHGGRLRLATDWEPYALHMLAVLDTCDQLVNCAGTGYVPRPDIRPLTRFERRGQRLGHGVWDLEFRRS